MIAQEGIEATDLSFIAAGTPRAAVESVLGEPLRSIVNKLGTIDTYEYDRGRRPGKPEDLGVLRCDDCVSDGALGYAFVYLLTQPYWINEMYKEQKGEIDVTYGPDDVVVRTTVNGHEEVANELVIRKAACGEANSQYKIGWGYENGFSAIYREPRAKQPAEAYFWYTLSAERGHTAAREGVERLEAKLSASNLVVMTDRAASWKPLDNCDF